MIMSELPAMPAAPGAGSAAAEGSGVSCGICHNDSLREVGELEVCFHRWATGCWCLRHHCTRPWSVC